MRADSYNNRHKHTYRELMHVLCVFVYKADYVQQLMSNLWRDAVCSHLLPRISLRPQPKMYHDHKSDRKKWSENGVWESVIIK